MYCCCQCVESSSHIKRKLTCDCALNPETGKPWGEAGFDGTKNTEELDDLGLTEQDIDDIVSFMLTFTDQRFE